MFSIIFTVIGQVFVSIIKLMPTLLELKNLPIDIIAEGFNDPYDTVSIFHIKKLYSYAKLKIEEQKELIPILRQKNKIDND